MAGEDSVDLQKTPITSSEQPTRELVTERSFYTKPFTEEKWLQIIRKGRGGTHGRFDGYLSCLARVTDASVITGLFGTGVHYETLASQKDYFALGDLPDSEVVETLQHRKGEEYGITAAQLWFNSEGMLTRLDFTISTDFLRAKKVKAIARDLLHKVPRQFWPEKLEIRLDDREHSNKKRPVYYLMRQTEERDWGINKSPTIRAAWKTPWD